MMNITKKINKARSLVFDSRFIRNRFSSGYISFTFDDFHASAYRIGATLLEKHGLRGTFYTSLGLLGKNNGHDVYFSRDDMDNVVSAGHEIGCHTYSHCSAYAVNTGAYITDVHKNVDTIRKQYADIPVSSFAFPYGEVTPGIKRELSKLFTSCRGVDQPGTFLSSEFLLDLFYIIPIPINGNGEDNQDIFSKIDRCVHKKKWMVFYTHDIRNDHSPFGCSEAFFADVLEYAVTSGASILPVGNVVKNIDVEM